MAKLSREELEDIIERDAPGTRMVKRDATADPRSVRAQPEETTPDLETLRRKYLGTDAAPAATEEAVGDAEDDAAGEDDDDDDEIVAVEPAEPADPWDRGARAKAVVVSGKDKKIIGRQG